ncbi:ATP-binding cassette domain-containing protein [Paenibacillus sp. PL2-23]|uniref:ABC transporter ATP-binding protein n=1 Tax=Paenibacillus sp. PL2-23 TaxID=2100729 RepID=UPI0030F83907
MGSLFEIDSLSKRLPPDAEGRERILFSGLTAVIHEPVSIAITGASGQGKSTLLRMLACMEAVEEGDLRLQGKTFRQWDLRQWRQKVCYVAQQPVMLPGTVDDNLRIVSKLHGKPFDESFAYGLLERCGLEGGQLSKPASELSGGEKQRLALVRSLLLRPLMLLLDEVTASLDEENGRRVEELLLERQRSEGLTLIWVTHQPEQAQRAATLHWTLANGHLTVSEVAR